MPHQCKHTDRQVLSQVHHTEAEWKSILSPGQYRVLRQSGTELPLSSPLDHVRTFRGHPCITCSPSFDIQVQLGTGRLVRQ